MLVGHEVSTVQRSRWTGIKNGKLLELAAAEFDVFLTMDRNLEFQQNPATLPIAVLVVEAVSNRMGWLKIVFAVLVAMRLWIACAPRAAAAGY